MKPKIAVISRGDAQVSGASRVAADLSDLLVEDGSCEVHHWLGQVRGQWESHYQRLHGGPFLQFTRKACNWFSMQAGFPDFFTPEAWFHRLTKTVDYDLYHIHDTPRTASPLFIRWLSQRVPVLWTLHDCSPFTGGCLYPMDCPSFSHGCGRCPQLKRWPLKTHFDFTPQMLQYKKETVTRGNITAIAPSHWMADQAMRSGVFESRPVHIPYCVNSELFCPVNTRQARAEEGIPSDRFVILMSVHDLADERKGVVDAIAAIEALSFKPLVITFGSASDEVRSRFSDIDLRCLGFVEDRNTVAKYCALADVLLFPTYADNLPNSVLEAMACGTPTVGYSTGGMPDMIEHTHNGWLATTGNIPGLTEGLEFARQNSEALGVWSEKCRSLAQSRFSQSSFLNAHLSLYENVLRARENPSEQAG